MNIDPRIRQTIAEDFKFAAPVRDACFRIVELIEKRDSKSLRHLSYASLQRATASDLETLVAAIQYLSGARIELLVPKFEFIEEETIEEVPIEDVYAARQTGKFYHPTTGLPVEDFESYIFMFFVPGSAVVNI